MPRKHVSDLMVLRAYDEICRLRAEGHSDLPWPYELLAAQTGEPEKVCYSACERAEDRGLLDCGVSLRAGFLTDKGRGLLCAHATRATDDARKLRDQGPMFFKPDDGGPSMELGKSLDPLMTRSSAWPEWSAVTDNEPPPIEGDVVLCTADGVRTCRRGVLEGETLTIYAEETNPPESPDS